jgi:hypothetical protein
VKFRRKKTGEEKTADAPSEVAPLPTEFLTINEVLDKSGMVSLVPPPEEDGTPPEEEEGAEEAEEIDLSPSWEFLVDGLPLMQTISTKFSVFDGNTCQVVCEFVAAPGVNAALFNWLQKPVERSVRILIVNHLDEKIEQWDATATPAAFAAGEMEMGNGEPWVSTYQMSLKSIKIS